MHTHLDQLLEVDAPRGLLTTYYVCTYYSLYLLLTTHYSLHGFHLDELLEVDAARRVLLLHGELALLEIEWQLGREAAQVLGHLCSHGVHVPYYMHVHGMNMACACIK